MTDLSSFSKNDFDSAAWVNSLIDDVGEGESLDNHLTAVGMKLHMATQDYSEQLEAMMVDSMTTMPRMMSDVARLEDQLKIVLSEMRSISEHIHSVDKKSVSGIEELSRLDHLKTNLEKCKSTLEEHARWNQLEREAKQLLESGGILSETADRIEVMFKSLDMLKNLPGHEARTETCDTFRLTLLNALRPNIRKDMSDMSLTSLQEYLYVFQKLNSESEFEKEYVVSRPHSIKQLWDSMQPSELDSFSQWLALFLGSVSNFLQDEQGYVRDLFGEAQLQKLSGLLVVETLLPMKRNISDRLQRIDNPLMAHECYCVLDEFAKRLLPQMFTGTIAENYAVLEVVFGGFVKYIPQYLESEDRFLKNQMMSILTSIRFSSSFSTAAADEDELDVYADPIEELNVFAEHCLVAGDGFAQACLQVLRRCELIFGGVNVKQTVRIIVSVIQSMTRLMLVKLGNFGVALGLANSAADAQSEKAVDPYPQYAEESRYALKLGNSLSSNESDRQALSVCALKGLQAIGAFLRSLRSIESAICELCGRLQQNIQSNLIDAELDIKVKKLLPSSSGAAASSYGTQFSFYLVRKDDNQYAEMKSFLTNNMQVASSQSVFSSVHTGLKKLSVKVCELILNMSCCSPNKLLQNFAAEDVWNRTVAIEDVELIKQGILPQSAVTQVGEHLLAWVQDLESIGNSSALSDLQQLRGESSVLCGLTDGWQRVKAALDMSERKAIDQLSNRQTASKSVFAFEREAVQVAAANGFALNKFFEATNQRDMRSDVDVEIAQLDNLEEASDDSQQQLQFVNEWLVSIADSIVGLLLWRILEIEQLTYLGTAQLVVDIHYLSNVIQAVGIKPHPVLSYVCLLMEEDSSGLQQLAHALNSSKSISGLKDVVKLTSVLANALVVSK